MSEAIKVLIVDDEPVAREGLQELLQDFDDFQVVAEAANGKEALALIKDKSPDIVLLDIQMPGIDGFGVLQGLPDGEIPLFIFVTAYEQYAVQAFEAHAVDYLLKPYDKERLDTALTRAKERLAQRNEDNDELGLESGLAALMQKLRPEKSCLERFVVKRRGRIALVGAREVEWLEAAGNYVHLHVEDGRPHLVRDTLSHLETELDPSEFIRIHRSAIVRLPAVAELEPLGSGDYLVRLKSGREVTMSRSYRRAFEQRLGRAL